MKIKALLWATVVLLSACDKVPAPEESFAGLGSDAADFAQVVPGKVFSFPEDHGPHDGFRIEWWYVTANLKDAQGNLFGVQWTLFRNALKAGPTQPGWHDSTVWLGHAAVTSATRHYAAERYARGGIGQAGAQAVPFNAWIDDWNFVTRPGAASPLADMQLTARGPQFAYDLHLTSNRPLVLQGDKGYSRKSDQGQASYYYSQPFFAAAGSVTLDGKNVPGQRPRLARPRMEQPTPGSQPDRLGLVLAAPGPWRAVDAVSRAAKGRRGLPDWHLDRPAGPHPDPAQCRYPAHTTGHHRHRRAQYSHALVAENSRQTTGYHPLAVNPNAWMNLSIPYWEGPVQFDGGVGYLEMTGY